MEQKRYVYIGICKCGSVVSACVDDQERLGKKEIAKFCSETIKDGLILERITVEDARNRLERCKCNKKEIEPDMFEGQCPIPYNKVSTETVVTSLKY